MLNTYTTLPARVQEFYDRQLLIRAVPKNIHGRWGMMKSLPKHSSKVMTFRRLEALGVDAAPLLTEGVTKPGEEVSKTDYSVTMKTYGKAINWSDELVIFNDIDPLLTEFTDLLGENMGTTLDYLVRDVLITGTQVSYANGSARNTLNTVLSKAQLDMAIRTLDTNDSFKINEMVSGSQKIATVPVPAGYVMLTHPYTTTHLKRSIPDWTAVHRYSDPGKAMAEETGFYDKLRGFESTNCKIVLAGGAAVGSDGMVSAGAVSNDVYITLILAKHFYGEVDVRGENAKIIVKDLGSSGTADAFDQRGSTAWKARIAHLILNDKFGIRLEHTNKTTLS